MKEKILQALESDYKSGKFNSLGVMLDRIFDLLENTNRPMCYAQVGDYLKCTVVYPQSKRYTVGKMYQIMAIEMYSQYRDNPTPHFVVRDDNNRKQRIDQFRGVSYTYFNLIPIQELKKNHL